LPERKGRRHPARPPWRSRSWSSRTFARVTADGLNAGSLNLKAMVEDPLWPLPGPKVGVGV